MHAANLLKAQAELAYSELLGCIKDLDEKLAWAKVECQPGEYLHSEGSILSLVYHIAGGKSVYGGWAYRNHERGWGFTVEAMEKYWPSWNAAKDCLAEAHEYWMNSWSQESDFERLVDRFNGEKQPSWKIITTVTQHDVYHGGQIQVLRSTLAPTDNPPPEEGDLWRKYCAELPSW